MDVTIYTSYGWGPCKLTKDWLTKNNKLPMEINCQIRYNGYLSKATLSKKEDKIHAEFNEPQLAITPGQSIVFYKNEECLGGGIIEPYVD